MSSARTTILRNGRVVTPEGEIDGDVCFSRGKIIGVGKLPQAEVANPGGR